MIDEKEHEEFKRKLYAQIDKNIRSEAHMETILFREVQAMGGLAIKFNPTGNAGLPDVIIFHCKMVWLVELKTEKGTVREHQKNVHQQFARRGFPVRVIKGRDQLIDFIDELKMI